MKPDKSPPPPPPNKKKNQFVAIRAIRGLCGIGVVMDSCAIPAELIRFPEYS